MKDATGMMKKARGTLVRSDLVSTDRNIVQSKFGIGHLEDLRFLRSSKRTQIQPSDQVSKNFEGQG